MRLRRMLGFAMRHIPGVDRSQVLLLREAVDDYVGLDNTVRFIDAFVDSLDLAAAGFERAAPKATGRPGYDPADLLKLYIYGYLNRVRSSCRLEAESKRNLEVIWLLRRLSPDFKTIADFRRINRAAFRQVFRGFVRLCRELELFGRELVAVDGTRIKAVNSRERNFTKAKLEKALSQGLFPKERFRYEGGEDIYICPNGQRLAPYRKRGRRGMFFVSYANRTACAECKLKSKCTKSAFRRVLRYVDEAILDRMAERLAARPELLDARRECVEHPFGSIKQWMGQGAFLTRRLENVRGEFSITALAYNIRRAISLVGVPALIAAARA